MNTSVNLQGGPIENSDNIVQEAQELTYSATEQATLIELWAKLWTFHVYDSDWEGSLWPVCYISVDAVFGAPGEGRIRDVWDTITNSRGWKNIRRSNDWYDWSKYKFKGIDGPWIVVKKAVWQARQLAAERSGVASFFEEEMANVILPKLIGSAAVQVMHSLRQSSEAIPGMPDGALAEEARSSQDIRPVAVLMSLRSAIRSGQPLDPLLMPKNTSEAEQTGEEEEHKEDDPILAAVSPSAVPPGQGTAGGAPVIMATTTTAQQRFNTLGSSTLRGFSSLGSSAAQGFGSFGSSAQSAGNTVWSLLRRGAEAVSSSSSSSSSFPSSSPSSPPTSSRASLRGQKRDQRKSDWGFAIDCLKEPKSYDSYLEDDIILLLETVLERYPKETTQVLCERAAKELSDLKDRLNTDYPKDEVFYDGDNLKALEDAVRISPSVAAAKCPIMFPVLTYVLLSGKEKAELNSAFNSSFRSGRGFWAHLFECPFRARNLNTYEYEFRKSNPQFKLTDLTDNDRKVVPWILAAKVDKKQSIACMLLHIVVNAAQAGNVKTPFTQLITAACKTAGLSQTGFGSLSGLRITNTAAKAVARMKLMAGRHAQTVKQKV